MSQLERYDLSIIQHSKETKPKKKSFINLDDCSLGFTYDREKQKLGFYIYKGKRKNVVLETEPFSIDAELSEIRNSLESLISRYYERNNRDPTLPMYTVMELRIIASHMFFHCQSRTIDRLVKKETIYN